MAGLSYIGHRVIRITIHEYGISFFTMTLLLLSIIPDFRSLRFLLVVFLVRIWLAFDRAWTIFPVPVTLKRFAAPRFVFILGIVFILFL